MKRIDDQARVINFYQLWELLPQAGKIEQVLFETTEEITDVNGKTGKLIVGKDAQGRIVLEIADSPNEVTLPNNIAEEVTRIAGKSIEITFGNKYYRIKIKNFNLSKDDWLMGRYINGKLEVVGKTKIAQKWDFIVTTKGEILVGRKHSWLSKGEDVLAAGEVKYRNGKLVEISNASGHYLPTIEESSNFLKIFKEVGVDIESATLTILQKDGTIYKQISPNSKERILYIKQYLCF